MSDLWKRLTFSLSGRKCDLLGQWQREGDNFAGCLVSIDQSDAGLTGTLVYVPPAMSDFGWSTGQTKWRQIRRQSKSVFRLQDLFLELDAETRRPTREVYRPSKAYFVDEGLILVASSLWTGRRTLWRRISDS